MTSGQFIDLTGQTFGRLRVVERHPGKGMIKWDCICQCGTQRVIAGVNLRNGWTQSCGCLRREASKERASARARRGGLRIADPFWRKSSNEPINPHASEPPKQWHGATEALRDLDAMWNGAYRCQSE